jgi:hypothetical protein
MSLTVGQRLLRRPEWHDSLIVEALVAARRHEDVAGPVRGWMGQRADWLAGLMQVARASGELDPAVSPAP